MKLYATVTSERASKGQGGNYLELKIQDKGKRVLWTILVNENENGKSIRMDIVPTYPDQTSARIDGKDVFLGFVTKGEKQKGECACPLRESNIHDGKTCSKCKGRDFDTWYQNRPQ